MVCQHWNSFRIGSGQIRSGSRNYLRHEEEREREKKKALVNGVKVKKIETERNDDDADDKPNSGLQNYFVLPG